MRDRQMEPPQESPDITRLEESMPYCEWRNSMIATHWRIWVGYSAYGEIASCGEYYFDISAGG